SAHLELELVGHGHRGRHEAAVRLAPMNLGEPVAHVRANAEACIPHAQGLEDPLAQDIAEQLPGDRLDGLAGPVYAYAVFPARARIAQKRHVQGCIEATRHARDALTLAVAGHGVAEEIVGETR